MKYKIVMYDEDVNTIQVFLKYYIVFCIVSVFGLIVRCFRKTKYPSELKQNAMEKGTMIGIIMTIINVCTIVIACAVVMTQGLYALPLAILTVLAPHLILFIIYKTNLRYKISGCPKGLSKRDLYFWGKFNEFARRKESETRVLFMFSTVFNKLLQLNIRLNNYHYYLQLIGEDVYVNSKEDIIKYLNNLQARNGYILWVDHVIEDRYDIYYMINKFGKPIYSKRINFCIDSTKETILSQEFEFIDRDESTIWKERELMSIVKKNKNVVHEYMVVTLTFGLMADEVEVA